MDSIDTFALMPYELLEVKNFDLQKRVLLAEIDKVKLQEELLMRDISTRAKIDMHQYVVDLNTGICTLKQEVKAQLEANKKMRDAKTTGSAPPTAQDVVSVEDTATTKLS